jgi:hypothetical protein
MDTTMKLKIFSCHHAWPEQQFATPIYQTLVTNVLLGANAVARTDLTGDNIGHLTKFSELRHQYFVWQNELTQYDYVGFEHYRRPVYLDPLPCSVINESYPLLLQIRDKFMADIPKRSLSIGSAAAERFNLMRQNLAEPYQRRLINFVASHDILCAHVVFEDAGYNFLRSHPESLSIWERFVADLARRWTGIFPDFAAPMPASWSGYFDLYISILFPVLLALDQEFPEAPPRIWGHMSERLLGAFITQQVYDRPLLRYRAIPYLFLDSVR